MSLVNAAKICAMYKGVPPNNTLCKEDIKKKIEFWCEKFSCIRDKLSETNSIMKGPPLIIRMKDNVPDNPPKSFTAATVPRAYDTSAKNLFTDLQEGGQIVGDVLFIFGNVLGAAVIQFTIDIEFTALEMKETKWH